MFRTINLQEDQFNAKGNEAEYQKGKNKKRSQDISFIGHGEITGSSLNFEIRGGSLDQA